MNSGIISLLLRILCEVLERISPVLRGQIEKVVRGLYAGSKETENPFDDVAIVILAALLKIDLPE